MNNKDFLKIFGEIDDKYILEASPKKTVETKIIKILAFAACFLITFVCLFNLYQRNQDFNFKSNTTYNNSQINIVPFNPSPKDPDSDFIPEQKDPTLSIELIINGNRNYRQIDKEYYKQLGINSTINSNDFGKKIGTVSKIDSYQNVISTPCSTESNIINAEVYYYSPIGCEALIIVKNEKNCSIFAFQNFTDNEHNMSELYDIYGIKSSSDIKSIEYVSTGKTNNEILSIGAVTNAEDINTFYEITNSLIGFSTKNSHYGTPEWLNEARENYENKVYIDITIKFKNELSLDIQYQPNLGTGYISGYYFISKEENDILKSILN